MSTDGMTWAQHNEFVSQIIDNCPEMWDDDVAQESIAIDYVRYLEKEVVRRGGALHPSMCPATVHKCQHEPDPNGMHCECWQNGGVCCDCETPWLALPAPGDDDDAPEDRLRVLTDGISQIVMMVGGDSGCSAWTYAKIGQELSALLRPNSPIAEPNDRSETS